MSGEGLSSRPLGVLGWLGLLMLATVPLFAGLTVLDPRTLDGAPLWTKPLKFSVSLAVFFLTLAMFRRWLDRGATERLWYRVTVGALTLALAYESAWLWSYTARGQRSHFNTDGAALLHYNLAGLFAFVLVLGALAFGLSAWRARRVRPDPVVTEGVALGLVLTFVLTTIVAFPLAATNGALGGSPSGPGAGWFGWRVEGSDLRAAHFFATHAMQAVPLLAWLSARLLPRGPALLVLRLCAAGYALFVGRLAIGAFLGDDLPWFLHDLAAAGR